MLATCTGLPVRVLGCACLEFNVLFRFVCLLNLLSRAWAMASRRRTVRLGTGGTLEAGLQAALPSCTPAETYEKSRSARAANGHVA